MTDVAPFSGAKIILFRGDDMLVYLRDDTPSIPYPGQWDLPGGGREGDESPVACALRETVEEFGLHLAPERIGFARRRASERAGGKDTWMLAAELDDGDIAGIVFGDEGQRWQLMPMRDFIAHPGAVDFLRERVAEFLQWRGGVDAASPA